MASVFPRSQASRLLPLGFLENQFFEDNPPTVKRLKMNTKREIRRIPADMFGSRYRQF